MIHDHNAADVHPAYQKAFNAGDIDATVACYESQGCFVSKSGRIARGAAELREVYRITFSNKPQMKFDIRKVITAGDDLALVIVGWTSVLSSGESKVLSGTATDIVRRQADGTWKLVLDNPYGIE
jgi:uncharacterized protein (TIGR02246 family)